MSAEPVEADAIDGVLLPRERMTLAGHRGAERAVLDAYRSGRMPHGWLFLGPRGIGKATLAFRLARFVLTHPDPASPAVRTATSLAVPPDAPAARRIAAGAHPDVIHARRPFDEKTGRLRTELVIDEIRQVGRVFGETAAGGGWRVAIVDAADDMNANAANALLKVLEEPPRRAILVVIAHRPGAVLATIRSRCRRLDLAPLDLPDLQSALAAAVTGGAVGDLTAAAEAAGGSVRRALLLLEGDALAVRQRFLDLAGRLPRLDIAAAYALAESVAGRGKDEAWGAFEEAAADFAHDRLGASLADVGRANGWAEAAGAVAQRIRETDIYNLDRKSAVIAVMRALADAAADPVSPA